MTQADIKEKAKQLLAQGVSKTEIADRLGISRRTVLRWSKEDDFVDAIANGFDEELIEEFDIELATTAKEILPLEQRIDDLLTYQNSQRDIAIATGDSASKLLTMCQSIVEYLQQNPAEINPRMLPQLAKAASDMAKASSECWARATGLDARVRVEVSNEVEARKAGFYLARSASGELKKTVFRYYPINPGEDVRTEMERFSDDFT